MSEASLIIFVSLCVCVSHSLMQLPVVLEQIRTCNSHCNPCFSALFSQSVINAQGHLTCSCLCESLPESNKSSACRTLCLAVGKLTNGVYTHQSLISCCSRVCLIEWLCYYPGGAFCLAHSKSNYICKQFFIYRVLALLTHFINTHSPDTHENIVYLNNNAKKTAVHCQSWKTRLQEWNLDEKEKKSYNCKISSLSWISCSLHVKSIND